MAKLKIYNFLTQRKEVFKPIKKNQVGFYACGPTVYNYAHIGNLRTYIFEDVLRRTLEYAGYRVKPVMNITDVDDKIIKAAGANIGVFTKKYESAFYVDLQKLNIRKAERYPKATKHIKEMVALVRVLLQKKFAYQTESGVFFDISKFKKYGALSRLKKRGLKTGARVLSDEYEKQNAQDFVLWKTKKPQEPFWQSPFGPGRPGWHLECSAMSMKYLGKSFDIHAGGIDLLFPHHENEIAQSEAATGKPFAKYFLEGEHLLVDGKKMSKSLGNILTLRDIERRGADPFAFRYLALTSHYRSPLNFTWESLEAAQNSLERLRGFVLALKQRDSKGVGLIPSFRKDFQKTLFSDLNTPKALAVLWDLVTEVNKNPKKYDAKAVLGLFCDFDRVLGLGLAGIKPETPPSEALKLLKEREKARKLGDFKKADEIRKRIRRLGWQVSDSRQGSQLFHI